MALTSYPVSGSQVEITYEGNIVAYGQGLKLDLKIDYQTVRRLGSIWPATLIATFATVSGAFTVLDTKSDGWLRIMKAQIDESQLSSDPSQWPQVTLRAVANNNDAPTYSVTSVRFIDLSPTVDISGNALATTITFLGLGLASE
jgi:hypothetical protein